MRKLSLLTLTIFFAQNLFSQGTWTQLTDLPGSGRHHACSFVIGDSAYIATGSGTDDFFRYDIHNDSWIQLPNFPGGNRNYAIGFSINGKGYISCGYDGSVSNMEIWEFDPTTAIWTQKTSGPAIGRVHPAFSVVGDRVYIGQGQQNGTWSDLADWYEYNATTDTWTAKTTFMSLRHHAAGATVGNTIYVGTGHHLDTMHDDWYAYDATNDTWQVKSNFTGNGRSAANSVASNGKVYFFAGEDEINFARFDDFREYDPISDSWSNLETFPADGRWAPYMFVHNDTIYVGGGEDEQQVNRKDLWRYDFSSVGLEEFDVNTAAVFPNPSSNVVNIPMKGENTIEIYNSLGQLVFKEKIQGQQVNVEKLDPGMYILRAREKNYSSRLSIQR